MQVGAIQRILGLLLMIFSFSMLPSLLVSLLYNDSHSAPFVLAFGVTLLTGFVLWVPVQRNRRDLRLRDGFVVVVMFWTVLSLFGALPFIFSAAPHLSTTDAIFESISGLTTTGATVITGIDNLPPSMLFYRHQLQWLGGMGIIVLAVAILPMLGIGGMQLYRAETPGPMKDNKLTPRITETAKALWYIYLSLTVTCTLAYWLAGMTFFDAICHAFSTVAIGGFSTHDASMGYFQEQPLIELIAIVFMFLSGINFAVHFMAWRSRNIRYYLLDSEFRTYLAVLGVISLITVFYLHANAHFEDFNHSLQHGLFQVISIGTTTGFTTSNYALWPGFLPVLLLFASFIGGCAGSTGGGMKVIRFLLLLKQGVREVTRLVHPNAVIPIKVGGKPLPEQVIHSVWGFFATYVAVFSIFLLLLMMVGLDQITAFSAVAATINNLGPGLGDVALHYGNIPDFAKWVLCVSMLLGRLEIFTLLVLLTPAFWRK